MPSELIFFSEAVFIAAMSLLLLLWCKEALIAFFVLQLICANLFVLKTIHLFGLEVTSSDVFTIGTLFTLACLQEHFGKKAARSAIWIGVAMTVVFGFISLFHGSGYQWAPRIFFSSVGACLLSDRVDLFLYSTLKMRIQFRFIIATILSQFLDTALFTLLALTGHNFNLKEMFIFSFIVKITAIFSMSFATPLIQRVKRVPIHSLWPLFWIILPAFSAVLWGSNINRI